MTTPATQSLINAAEQFRAAFHDGNAGTPEMLEYFDGVFEEALEASPAASPSVLRQAMEALEAAKRMWQSGQQPRKLDDALTWRQCDEKALELVDASVAALRSELAAVPQQPVARLHASETETGKRMGLFETVILDRARCHDDMYLYASPPLAARPAMPVYANAIGEAGQRYHSSFPHAHPLPALWRWQELWDAMCAAVGCTYPQCSCDGPADDGGCAARPVVAMSDERAQFEAWARQHRKHYSLERTNYPGDHGNGDYLSIETYGAWSIWQARAALASVPATPAAAPKMVMVMLTWDEAVRASMGQMSIADGWNAIQRAFAAKNGFEIERLDRAHEKDSK